MLGVELICPFAIHGGDGIVVCTGYLPHFATNRGMCFNAQTQDPVTDAVRTLARVANKAGLWCSTVCLADAFDLEEYKDALADWGYHGPPELRPAWLDTYGKEGAEPQTPR